MDLMQTLRTSRRASRWLVLWFLAALGFATVAPLVQAQPMVLVCSASGNHWVAVDTGEPADAAQDAAGLHCPFCLPVAGPITEVSVLGLAVLPAAAPAGPPGAARLDPEPRAAHARGPPASA